MIIDEVKEVLSVPFETVVSTPLSFTLLHVYSRLYLAGGQPRSCTSSQRQYYNQLKKNGVDMAQKYAQSKPRTCKPAWKGNRLINATKRHWNSETLTDEEAKSLLKQGFLKESDFDVLPDSGKDKKASEEKASKAKAEKEKQPAKAEKTDSEKTKPEDAAAAEKQKEAELNCIIEFSEHLKAGKTREELLDMYKDIEKIGDKQCNPELLSELISEAEKTV